MSPKPDVSDERKPQILLAAETVFAQKGLSDARMDDIAEETGLSKGTLYLYYKSKDDLIIALLDRLFQYQFKEAEGLLSLKKSSEERLRQFMELAIRDISVMLKMTPVSYELLAFAFRNKHVRRSLKLYLNRYLNILVPLIQQGIDSGEFRQVPAHQAAIAAGAIFEGTILLWVYDHSQVDVPSQIRMGMDLLIEGLKVR